MTDYTELKRLAEAGGDLNGRAIQENWCEWAIRDDHGYSASMPTISADGRWVAFGATIALQPLFALDSEVRSNSLAPSMQLGSGGRFLMLRDDPDALPEILVVVNWLEELKARLAN